MRLHVDALSLVGMPFAFTQDDLLTSEDFERKARDLDIQVDSAILQALHSRRHLLPLFRIDDEAVSGRRLQVPTLLSQNSARGWTLQAAIDGRLRDPALEGVSIEWPYDLPEGGDPKDWWNGFVFSSWQLLDLADLASELSTAQRHYRRDGTMRSTVDLQPFWSPLPAKQRRARALALSALANRYLPDIVGRASLPSGGDWAEWTQSRVDLDPGMVLAAVGVDPADLQELARSLLFSAHSRDPLRDWIPLIRRASSAAWDRLRGAAQLAIRQRIAAEILLRAHEDLARHGTVDVLPDVKARIVWDPFLDRLGAQDTASPDLDSVLSDFGLSPHPRVLMLVEGETEALHVERILHVLNIDRSLMRVQSLGGDKRNPNLLARYVISPRLGRATDDGWMLSLPLTALFIATDPGGLWGPAKLDRSVGRVREAIRTEVKRQGGAVGDDVLDLLVTAMTWDQPCYELANFSDDELTVALQTIARRNRISCTTPTWLRNVHEDLQRSRSEGINVEIALRHARTSKMELAEELWPILADKLGHERVGTVVTPIILAVDRAMERAREVPRGAVQLPGKR